MPVASIAASVVGKTAGSTLVVMPLVLTSVAVTGYARYTSSRHPHASSEQEQRQEDAHQAEVLHQHVVHPWKGTR